MFFDKSVICKGREYNKGKVEGVICFRDEYAIRQKRNNVSVVPIIFNSYKIGAESIINCDGIIVFEDCFNDAIKEIIDKTKVPCVIIQRDKAKVEKVSYLVGQKLTVKEGDTVIIDGKSIKKAGEKDA